jgi:glycerol-3-phosphate acyltransferase PlsY
MTIAFILLTIGAYFLGSVPAAYLIAKWTRGIDIRKYGSGNAGASNVLTVVSKWWSVPVIIFDVGKGMLAVYIAQLVDLEVYQQVVVGIAAIAGHNWPVFLHFNGGRGGLTTLGVAFIFAPKLAVMLLVIAFLCYPFHQLALGVLMVIGVFPILAWFFSQLFNVAEPLPVSLGFLVILLILVFRRLTAPKTSVTASVSRWQLFVNRLLFDRDIRDRGAWIRRRPVEQQEE